MPTITRKLAEIVELYNTACAEYFQPFLGKGFMAVGEIMDRSHRTICKTESKCGFVAGRRGVAAAQRSRLHVNDGRPCQAPQQVDEVTGFADDAPPPTARSCVQCSRGMAPAFTVMTIDLGSTIAASIAFIFCTCGAKRRVNPTMRTGAFPACIASA